MREEEVFLAVLDLPDAAARATFLDRACGTDTEFRRKIEILLDAHFRSGPFLDAPAGDRLEAKLNNDNTVTLGADSAPGKPNSDDDSDDLHFLAPANRPDSLGRIGHYEVLQVLGKGGFGIVFRAFDDMLQRVVAIKVMSPQLAATSPARKRFLREARTSAAVRHENVVQVYEVQEQPFPFLAMEFIPGETLQQKLDRTGPLEVPEVLRIGRQIAEGLAAAHANDLIHRDIKPANILIEGGQHRVKITDFGLARAADDASISQSGIIAGTRMYMAPEQALGNKLDQRADLFSLGSVLYQIVAGRPPFRANNTLAVLKRVAEDTPRDIREIIPETPQWLCDIIAKLHAKNPEERYQSAREVADVLADCEEQLKASTKLKDFSRIPSGKPAATGKWKWVLAFVLLPLIAIGLTELSGITRLLREQPSLSKGKITPDRELLQGRWRIVSVDFNGVPLTPEEVKDIDWINFSGDEFSFNCIEDGKETVSKGKFKIEAASTPKQLDLFADTPTPNRTIYEIDGENLIVAESGDADGSRPTSFNSSAKNILVKRLRRDLRPDSTAELSLDPKRGKPAPTFKNTLGMEFVLVPKGKSWLGGSKDKPGDKEVEIPADFYLGKYEVTQEEWEKVMGENPSQFSRTGKRKDVVKDFPDADLKRFPVEYVSWDQCQVFVAKLNQQENETGWVYRLPKEVEWEYACRGGPMADKADSAFEYYFAKPTNTLLPEQANFSIDGYGKGGLGRTCKVGSYETNPLGFHDMHGNVIEWLDDTDENLSRLSHGGSFFDSPTTCRASARVSHIRSNKGTGLGLRLARVPAVPPLPEAKTPVADANRRAAEYALSVGGPVRVSGVKEDISAAADLPREPFRLTFLVLRDNSALTDNDLAVFGECSDLTHVFLFGSRTVSDAGLRHFAQCKQLKVLAVGGTSVTDAGLTLFKDLTTLEWLHVAQVPVTGEGLSSFRGCKNLQHLNLHGCAKFTDNEVPRLINWPNLTQLYLDESGVTDAGVEQLAAFQNLTELRLQKTQVTMEGVEKLARALPNCKIEWDGGVIVPKLAIAPFTEADVQRIAALPAPEQVEEVRTQLKRLNPKFDGKLTPKIENNVVTGLAFNTDEVVNLAPLRGLKGLTDLDCRGTYRDRGKLSDLSPLKGMTLKRLDCSSTQISDLTPLVGMPLTILHFNHNPVSDLSPVKQMPLLTLGCAETKVADFTPLMGMKLETLWAMLLPATDLTPLNGLPLKHLDLYHTIGVTNLAPLKGMPLEHLNLQDVPVSDLSVLKGMTTLRSLHLQGNPLSDLAPLQGLKLQNLIVMNKEVSDLTPLKGMPLVSLSIHDSGVIDLKPLQGMELELIRFTPSAITQGLEILRNMKSLKTIGIPGDKSWPAAEFWERYDKGEFKK